MSTGCARVGLVILAAVWAAAAPGGRAGPATTPAPETASPDGRVEGLVEQLSQVGERLRQTSDPPAIAACCLQQADLITQILAAVKPEERDPWVRHLAGCLSGAAANAPAHDQAAYRRLANLAEELAQTAPGSALAAHVAFVELEAACALRSADPGADAGQAPEYRRQRLAQFVEAYPQGEDTPAALAELAQDAAGLGADARARYRRLAESFPDNPQAAQARAALRRVELRGQEIDLTLPLLHDPSQPFSVSRLRGQVVVVYCWSSGDQRCRSNCESLRRWCEQYGSKGLAVALVNLDRTLAQGQQAWQATDLPAVQLYAEGGLDGAWAKAHGVAHVPTVFLVGKDGRVVTQVVDKETLAQELARLFRENTDGPQR